MSKLIGGESVSLSCFQYTNVSGLVMLLQECMRAGELLRECSKPLSVCFQVEMERSYYLSFFTGLHIILE